MILKNDRELKITTGESRFSTNWKLENLKWSTFIQKLSLPIVTDENYKTFMELPKSKQDKLKDVGGYICRRIKGKPKKI